MTVKEMSVILPVRDVLLLMSLQAVSLLVTSGDRDITDSEYAPLPPVVSGLI